MSFITKPTISTHILTDRINIAEQPQRIRYTRKELLIIAINVLGTTIINNNANIFSTQINIQ